MSPISKICLSKKAFLYTLLIGGIISFLLLSNLVITTKVKTNTKAAPHNIIGGSNAYFGEFPAVTYIESDESDGSGVCTGTLIHPRLVLTAAHCLKGKNIWVRVGLVKLGQDPSTFTARKSILTIPHPAFIEVKNMADFYLSGKFLSDQNDIGLILLENEVTGVALPHIPQPNTDSKLYDEKNITTAVGWGATGYTTEGIVILPDTLQKLDLPIYSSDNTQKKIIEVGYYDKNASHTTSSGDSGGPIFITKDNVIYILGVLVGGYDTKPSKYTNLIAYSDWLNSQIAMWSSYKITSFPPFVENTKFDNDWSKCFNLKTESQCNSSPYNLPNNNEIDCGYVLKCNVCLPWDSKMGIDYNDCANIFEKLRRVILSRPPERGRK